MKNLPKCYGSYGTGSCEGCDAADWCADAADPPISSEKGYYRVFFEHLEDAYDFRTEGEDEGSRLSKLFGELIYELETDKAQVVWEFLATMSALSKEHPHIYRVVRARILHPAETYTAIGEMLDMSRQSVEVHLRRCVELIPSLRSAIGMPHERLRESKVRPFEVRCSGGMINILAGAASAVLCMPMTVENSGIAPKIVDGLNNLHWRRRDALLKEIGG